MARLGFVFLAIALAASSALGEAPLKPTLVRRDFGTPPRDLSASWLFARDDTPKPERNPFDDEADCRLKAKTAADRAACKKFRLNDGEAACLTKAKTAAEQKACKRSKPDANNDVDGHKACIKRAKNDTEKAACTKSTSMNADETACLADAHTRDERQYCRHHHAEHAACVKKAANSTERAACKKSTPTSTTEKTCLSKATTAAERHACRRAETSEKACLAKAQADSEKDACRRPNRRHEKNPHDDRADCLTRVRKTCTKGTDCDTQEAACRKRSGSDTVPPPKNTSDDKHDCEKRIDRACKPGDQAKCDADKKAKCANK